MTMKKEKLESQETPEIQSDSIASVESPPMRQTTPQKLHPILLEGQQEDHSELIEKMEWRRVRAASKSGRILSGILTGIEASDAGGELAVVDYEGYRALIPLEEMLIPDEVDPDQSDKQMLHKKVTRMLGAEIDFIPKAVEEETQTIVASRKAAMLKKAKIFYLGDGVPIITEGRVAQARMVVVGRQTCRVEVFGVETYMRFLELDWEWLPEVRDKYKVGDRIFVRVNTISGYTPETLHISVDAKSVMENPDEARLTRCVLQGQYIGRVVNITRGLILVRLQIGVNAIATGYTSDRFPGRGDDVCFQLTSIDTERVLVRGLITRVIKRNS